MQFKNEFAVTSIDLTTFDYPNVNVAVWSSLTRAGGSVAVEAKTPEGRRLTLYSEEIEEDRDVTPEREYAQELADDWNADLKGNWNQEILRCLRYVADYEKSQIASIDEHRAKLKKYQRDIRKLKAQS